MAHSAGVGGHELQITATKMEMATVTPTNIGSLAPLSGSVLRRPTLLGWLILHESYRALRSGIRVGVHSRTMVTS